MHTMLRRWSLFPLVLFASATSLADEPHAILSKSVKYDPAIPTPRSYLGFEIGERHIQHHELVGYLRTLAAASDRVTMEEYARSYGNRPLVLLTISSPDNHKRLSTIRRQHLQLSDPDKSAAVNINKLPAVINMGYGVHGNEPSAANVAPLVAYHLAAAMGEAHDKLLNNIVVLLDPCLNPDGSARFANWANNHRGNVLNSDPNHREHREPWPSGRTNYYWFDLNRDWLPAQHPESQGRLTKYHQWKPNVVLDFHEMSTNATYFFQPGVPKRNNPNTPQRTFELTREFAKEHAAALDREGSLYYSEERFDDFYMGKGSTYPDLHGAVGILFEQASARGHLQESVNGPLSFSFAIRNHWLTSLSSLRATLKLRRSLLEHKRTFYRDAQALVRSGTTKGYVVAAPNDPARLHHFLEVLARHEIKAYRLAKDLRAGGIKFPSSESFVIPAAQAEFRFLQDLFVRRIKFAENIFYDVSAWTLPLAFNIQHAELDAPPTHELMGEPFRADAFPQHKLETAAGDLAYVVGWSGYYAPKVLYQLLEADVKVKVATEPFHMSTGDRDRAFGYGSLLVPLGIQRGKRKQIVEILQRAGSEGVEVYPAQTGLTPSGIDFGSNSFRLVPKPKVLLVTGASAYEAGEVWHLLDRRFAMPVTLVEARRLASVKLQDYTVVVLVSGRYGAVSDSGVERLKEFLAGGGTVVATGTAVRWLNDEKIVSVTIRTRDGEQSADQNEPPVRRPYAAARNDAAFQLVRGAIFRTHVDHSHPIGYGFAENALLPVFRNNRVFLELTKNAYSTPIVYDEKPLLSGYISAENLKTLAGSASVVVHSAGQGRAILIAENPNFRAFWYGTNRVFLNSVFFGPLVRVP
jgi:hypothetical protein